MSWKRDGVWKTPLPINAKKKTDACFPGLGQEAKLGKFEYEELQKNELIALESIYGEDFIERKDGQSAWQKFAPSFDIRIRKPIGDSEDELSLKLGVVFTATYPRTPPILSLKECEHIPEAVVFKVHTYIETKPKEFAREEREEMMWTIAEGIGEILDDAAQTLAKGKALPSLEEERERHYAELKRRAEQEEREKERLKAAENQEEERVMTAMVEAQVERQRKMAKESRNRGWPAGVVVLENSHPGGGSGSSDGDRVDFDRLCEVTDRTGNVVTFTAVASKTEYRRGPFSKVYTVRPVVSSQQDCPVLILKETILRAGKDVNEFKKKIQALESCLEKLRSQGSSSGVGGGGGSVRAGSSARHRNVLGVLDFKIDSSSLAAFASNGSSAAICTVSILCPMAERGPLDELLDLAGTLDLSKVRAWTRDLLDALNFLHNLQICHQDIHAANILLYREPTGNIVPKVADAAYQRHLHNVCSRRRSLPGIGSARSAFWLPPENAPTSKPQYTHKTDIWDFGVVFLQMIFGLNIVTKYHSPKALRDSVNLSPALRELVDRFFKEDVQKRARAFELGSSEFLATDSPILMDDIQSPLSSSMQSPSLMPPTQQHRFRRDSSSRRITSSRYTEDYVEEGRLGKGGFGEVVKARKKLDGQVYAIKKVTQKPKAGLTEILKEIRLLSTISHPAVVRYFNTWLEETEDNNNNDSQASSSSSSPSDESDSDAQGGTTDDEQESGSEMDMQLATSTGGLDFMSSNAPIIEFIDSDEDNKEEEEDRSESDEAGSEEGDSNDEAVGALSSSIPVRRRLPLRKPPRFKTTLYISMEYCENRTLRDLISRGLYKNSTEVWRLFRQVLEGLVHIHSLNIVHRDMKPENIFIGRGSDGLDNVKIGDFGLATSGQFAVERGAQGTQTNLDSDRLTSNIGTASYAAPEIRSAVTNGSSAGVTYSAKVDMYSLGIILFEMCYTPIFGMQRADVLGHLRDVKPTLPPDFKPADKLQAEIILSLLTHNAKERPSSAELLQSGKLPVPMESEQIRRALSGLADPASPYHPKVMNTLFGRQALPAKDYAWDMSAANNHTAGELLNRNAVQKALVSVFRRHGALELPRTSIYPRSRHYGEDAVQLLDSNGCVLQLPYDLTLGYARMLAKHTAGPVVQRTYAFGNVFRDKKDTGQPRMFGEVDFDIVTTDTLDFAVKEAEVLKVLDEIIAIFPFLYASQMCFHLGHSDLLRLIFEHCGVGEKSSGRTAEVLSKLNIQGWTWQKIRAELRSSEVGLSSTTVDELQRFDFRDTPHKVLAKLRTLFEGSDIFQRASSTLGHLKEVAEYGKRMGIACKIYVNPLSSLKESFYSGGILFSCLYDKKGRDVFAAGGRYDSLIQEHRPRIAGNFEKRHAVGFSLAWERLAKVPKTTGKAFLKKSEDEVAQGLLSTHRCDVLVASLDPQVLRSTGIELVSTLWAYEISAELAKDVSTPEELLLKHRDENHSWIITIKENSNLKIRNMIRREAADVEIASHQLLAWLRQEIRERDSRAMVKLRGNNASSHSHHHHQLQQQQQQQHHQQQQQQHNEGGFGAVDRDHEQDVKVLLGQTKSKKFNRKAVVEQAQAQAASLVQGFLDGPILAVETTDAAMDAIRTIRGLDDAEGWRRVEATVATGERKYIREMHDVLEEFATGTGGREKEADGGVSGAFIYNFRSMKCVYLNLEH